MSKLLGSVGAAVIMMSASAASADVTTLDCIDFMITLAEENKLEIEEAQGADYQEVVCQTAAQLPIDEYENPTIVDVRVEPIDYHLTVVVQKLSYNN